MAETACFGVSLKRDKPPSDDEKKSDSLKSEVKEKVAAVANENVAVVTSTTAPSIRQIELS